MEDQWRTACLDLALVFSILLLYQLPFAPLTLLLPPERRPCISNIVSLDSLARSPGTKTARIANSKIATAWRVYKNSPGDLPSSLSQNDDQKTITISINRGITKLTSTLTNFSLHDNAPTTPRSASFFRCMRCLFGIGIFLDCIWWADRHVYHVWSDGSI